MGWISVMQGLPDPGVDVLIETAELGVFIGFLGTDGIWYDFVHHPVTVNRWCEIPPLPPGPPPGPRLTLMSGRASR